MEVRRYIKRGIRMNEEKDFFKICFNIVAGLEVKNESQAIAKEVVLSEIEHLEQENKKQQEIIDKAIEYINMHKRKDGFLELNEWKTRDLLQILEDKEVR